MKYIYLLMLVFSLVSTNLVAKTLMIKVQVKNQQHKVVDAWLLEQNYPASSAPVSQRASVSYQLLNKSAQVQFEGKVYAPSTVSGAYLMASEEERAQLSNRHAIEDNTSYYIRVADYQTNMYELRLQPNSSTQLKAKTSTSKGFVLANWLR